MSAHAVFYFPCVGRLEVYAGKSLAEDLTMGELMRQSTESHSPSAPRLPAVFSTLPDLTPHSPQLET